MSTRAAALLSQAWSNPTIRNAVIGGGAGMGTSLLENQTLLRNADSSSKEWNPVLGTVTGATAGAFAGSGDKSKAIATLASWPLKSLGLLGYDRLSTYINQQAPIARQNLQTAVIQAQTAKANQGLTPQNLAMMGLAGAGIAGAGMGAYGLYKKYINPPEDKGRIRVTLPTREGDPETQVEMPLDAIRLSQSLRHGLGRDTRRRLRSEVNSGVEHKRKGQQDTFSPGEDGDGTLKAASVAPLTRLKELLDRM